MISDHAIIHPSAKIASNVKIDAFSIIGEDVEIAEGTWVGSNVVIEKWTRIGKNNKIFPFSSVGAAPQDLTYAEEKTYLEIGDRNTIREFCTLNRGTMKEEGVTRIGNDNLLMAYVHIAHDCQIGDFTVLSNNVTLAGHVKIEDYVVMGGLSAVYQFCRIGAYSFITGGSLIMKDVLPFTKVSQASENYAAPFGLNSIGLRRHGFTEAKRALLKQAYRIIYQDKLTAKEAVEALKPLITECEEINLLIQAIEQSKHGIIR